MLSSALTHSMLECTINAFGSARIVDGGTQSMPLSAAIKQRLVCGAREGPYSMLRSAAATNFAFPPSAQR